VVSKDTLEKIMVVMKHHLTPSQVRAIIAELNGVPGNKSFRPTVKAVAAALESEEGLERQGKVWGRERR
jgi:hypothetical protein